MGMPSPQSGCGSSLESSRRCRLINVLAVGRGEKIQLVPPNFGGSGKTIVLRGRDYVFLCPDGEEWRDESRGRDCRLLYARTLLKELDSQDRVLVLVHNPEHVQPMVWLAVLLRDLMQNAEERLFFACTDKVQASGRELTGLLTQHSFSPGQCCLGSEAILSLRIRLTATGGD